jgi:hypothetical protein
MASAGQDETIRLYDLKAGRPVGDGVPIPSGFIDHLHDGANHVPGSPGGALSEHIVKVITLRLQM